LRKSQQGEKTLKKRDGHTCCLGGGGRNGFSPTDGDFLLIEEKNSGKVLRGGGLKRMDPKKEPWNGEKGKETNPKEGRQKLSGERGETNGKKRGELERAKTSLNFEGAHSGTQMEGLQR